MGLVVKSPIPAPGINDSLISSFQSSESEKIGGNYPSKSFESIINITGQSFSGVIKINYQPSSIYLLFISD